MQKNLQLRVTRSGNIVMVQAFIEKNGAAVVRGQNWNFFTTTVGIFTHQCRFKKIK